MSGNDSVLLNVKHSNVTFFFKGSNTLALMFMRKSEYQIPKPQENGDILCVPVKGD